jgi:hypothetical protein
MTLTQAEMEARYDAERSGAVYVKPAPGAELLDRILALPLEEQNAVWEQAERIMLADEIDRLLAKPIQIVRHTHDSDGVLIATPWTMYTLGNAAIDVNEGSGGGNLCVYGHCIDLEFDYRPLLDLAMLLADTRLLDALDPSRNEQAICTWIDQQAGEPEATDDMIAILEEIDGGEAEARKGIDARFDRVIDAVAELPDAQRAQAIAMWEGFLVGCAAGA